MVENKLDCFAALKNGQHALVMWLIEKREQMNAKCNGKNKQTATQI